MPKPTVFDSIARDDKDAIKIILTPEIALEMLEANKINRPLRQSLVNRIADQIRRDLWKYNGDTIKISNTFDVLDGQHRLWAIAEAKRAVETLVVFGISREAFDTIDTIRNYRNAADTVSLEGVSRHRTTVAGALNWLIRYERGVLETYKAPANRVENSDVKKAIRDNPNIVAAAERTGPLRRIVNAGLMTFFYYVLSSQNTALAEEMVEVLVDPGRTPLNHPYYLLRTYLVSEQTRKEAVRTIALMIKTSNAAFRGAKLTNLPVYNPQGRNPERFPVLDVRNVRKTEVIR
jgi:hypothetical protein